MTISASAYNRRELAAGRLTPAQVDALLEAGARAIQADAGLLIDGKAGLETRAAIEGLLAPKVVARIDVSHDNGVVDWLTIARAGHAFAWIKATDGVTYRDARSASNWEGANAVGLLRDCSPDEVHDVIELEWASSDLRFSPSQLGNLAPEPAVAAPVFAVESDDEPRLP